MPISRAHPASFVRHLDVKSETMWERGRNQPRAWLSPTAARGVYEIGYEDPSRNAILAFMACMAISKARTEGSDFEAVTARFTIGEVEKTLTITRQDVELISAYGLDTREQRVESGDYEAQLLRTNVLHLSEPILRLAIGSPQSLIISDLAIRALHSAAEHEDEASAADAD